MASSEAVMVAPEQCATAPKTLVSKQAEAPAAAKTSTTRVVLLAVLALAAATGAMFGVVVFGNEFTKDMHPKGGALVDSEDRAVATAAVESYVSLLDLPLLGTAELNKVDGITFSTYKGIEHRKVTGYTVTKETAVVGDSEVATPRLSLATSAPGVTVEVSVRDNKAWLSEAAAGKVATTAIDATSQRRLADGGSCLENGACLYSRDELLHLDAASRRLEEGSFFARADVAAYQVELDGDVMPYLERTTEESAYLDGIWTEGGHKLRLRVAEMPTGTEAFFLNYTSGKSKLLTSKGTYMYTYDGRLYQCMEAYTGSIEAYTVDSLVDSMTFETVEVSHGGEAKADFIPFHPEEKDCYDLNTKRANLSTPEALEAFPTLAGAYQNPEVLQKAQSSFFSAKSRRRLAKEVRLTGIVEDRKSVLKEMASLLKGMKEQAQPRRELRFGPRIAGPIVIGGGISHFDLWVATRLADPTFIDINGWVTAAATDKEFVEASTLPAILAMDFGGLYGVSPKFVQVSGFSYVKSKFGDNPFASYLFRRKLTEEEEQAEADAHRKLFMFDDLGAFGNAVPVKRGPVMVSDDFFMFEECAILCMEMNPACEKAKVKFGQMGPEACAEGLDAVANGYLDEYGGALLSKAITQYDLGTIDLREVDCSAQTTMKNCMGYEAAGCSWNPMYDCCSEMGLPCGGAGAIDVGLSAVVSGVGSEGSAFLEYTAETMDFLSRAYPGSCAGGFLQNGGMLKATKIQKSCGILSKGSSMYGFAAMCTGGGLKFGKMLQPNAWGSLLSKGGVTVASFQGTKMHDASMLEYTYKRDPVYITSGSWATVTTEGYAMYFSQLATCMSSLSSRPAYITGHSLGGAAATMYAGMLGTGMLVTFGAPPTTYRSFVVPGLSPPQITDKLNLKTFASSFTISSPEEYIPPMGSIRYFHKFDPIPSFYFSFGLWAHGTEKALLLADYIDGDCSSPECGSGSMESKLTGWLCDGASIQTSATPTGPDYYSYMNMFNPLPCAEILLSIAYKMYPISGTVGAKPWDTAESFEGCTESYIGSISAYFGIYLASDLVSVRGDESERDGMDVATFYAAWGLMWIHSSYANYCLTGSRYGPKMALASPKASRGGKELISLAEKVYKDNPKYRPNAKVIEMMAKIAEEDILT